MPSYRNDPRIINARYPGKCSSCETPIQKGEAVYYYPSTKKILGLKACNCGVKAKLEFEAAAFDEGVMSGNQF